MYPIPEIEAFLLCRTPDSWVQAALRNLDILLIDHANNEKKAALQLRDRRKIHAA
jgi:tRNA-(ms[2]io[6]A)-hydroxylase